LSPIGCQIYSGGFLASTQFSSLKGIGDPLENARPDLEILRKGNQISAERVFKTLRAFLSVPMDPIANFNLFLSQFKFITLRSEITADIQENSKGVLPN
jgi:hypothetical protein